MKKQTVLFYRREIHHEAATAVAEKEGIDCAYRNLDYYGGEAEECNAVILMGDCDDLVKAYEAKGIEVSVTDAPAPKKATAKAQKAE